MKTDRIGFSFHADLEYMSKGERIEFEQMRSKGRLSIFRTSLCRVCKAEMLKGKTYCSKRCMMDNSIEATIAKLIDTEVILETKDGSRREGTLTEVTMHTLMVDGNEIRWPKGVVMNRDKHDEIPWDRLAWIKTA